MTLGETCATDNTADIKRSVIGPRREDHNVMVEITIQVLTVNTQRAINTQNQP